MTTCFSIIRYSNITKVPSLLIVNTLLDIQYYSILILKAFITVLTHIL
jgi:hypothetical protein